MMNEHGTSGAGAEAETAAAAAAGAGGASIGEYELMGMGGESSSQQQQQQQQQDQQQAPPQHSWGRPPSNDGPSGGDTTATTAPPPAGAGQETASVGDILTVLSARNKAREAASHAAEGGQWYDNDARPILHKLAFCMGDVRDGLAMVNMQSTFLMTSKGFTAKQCGILFLTFGVSQVVSMAPIGYLMDVSKDKIHFVMAACIILSFTTVLSTILAQPGGENMSTMIILKVFQGAASAVQSPGLNAITLGIVGTPGLTLQVSRNKMMCHIGTALIVCIASLLAYFLYPNIGLLFWVSPLFCCGVVYYMRRIKPEHVDTDAARGLIVTSPTMSEYEAMDEEKEVLMELMEHHRLQAGYVPPGEDGTATMTGCTGGMGGGVGSARRTTAAEPPRRVPSSVGGADDMQQILSMASSTGHPWDDDYDDDDDADAGEEGFDDDNALSLGPLGPDPCGGGGNLGSQDSLGANPSSGSGFGFRRTRASISHKMRSASMQIRRKLSPMESLLNPQLGVFTLIVFFFNVSNSSVLPLVMQSISLDDPQSGILLSGLCIVIGQSFMMPFAKMCGDYSPKWGRKRLFLLGLFSLPVRCVCLSLLAGAKESIVSTVGQDVLTIMILGTQLLDAVGAGIFGTLYILVTSDISGGTGRFSLMMGVTTGAMCLGSMVSGYLGQVLAQDFGYEAAFSCLGLLSFVPAFMYLFLMPETLPDYAKPRPKAKRRKRRMVELLLNINKRNNFFLMKNSPRHAPEQPDRPKVRTHL